MLEKFNLSVGQTKVIPLSTKYNAYCIQMPADGVENLVWIGPNGHGTIRAQGATGSVWYAIATATINSDSISVYLQHSHWGTMNDMAVYGLE